MEDAIFVIFDRSEGGFLRASPGVTTDVERAGVWPYRDAHRIAEARDGRRVLEVPEDAGEGPNALLRRVIVENAFVMFGNDHRCLGCGASAECVAEIPHDRTCDVAAALAAAGDTVMFSTSA